MLVATYFYYEKVHRMMPLQLYQTLSWPQSAKASREAAIEGPTILHIFFVACLTIPSSN